MDRSKLEAAITDKLDKISPNDDPYGLAQRLQFMADLVNYRLDSRAFFLQIREQLPNRIGLEQDIKSLHAEAIQLKTFWKEVRLNCANKLTTYDRVRLGALCSGPGYAGDANELHE